MTSPPPQDSWQRVGSTLKTFMDLRGMTMDELGQAMGVSRTYLANIQAGRRRLTPPLLVKACAALKIRQIDLLAEQPVDESVPA